HSDVGLAIAPKSGFCARKIALFLHKPVYPTTAGAHSVAVVIREISEGLVLAGRPATNSRSSELGARSGTDLFAGRHACRHQRLGGLQYRNRARTQSQV